MIGYVTLGTNDLKKAGAFYDQLFGELGAARLMEEEDKHIAWGRSKSEPLFAAIRPFDGKPATMGNGVMVAFFVDSTDKVHTLHRKALDMGSQDEGAPGPRGDGGFYGGYFRDMEGNKLCIYTRTNAG